MSHKGGERIHALRPQSFDRAFSRHHDGAALRSFVGEFYALLHATDAHFSGPVPALSLIRVFRFDTESE